MDVSSWLPEDLDDHVALLAQSLREDMPRMFRHTVVNSLAGSALVPRALRFMLYRSMGLDVRTPNVFHRSQFIGRNLRIDPGTFVNTACLLEATGPLCIGRDCQIAHGVTILTTTHPLYADGTFAQRPVALATTVGDRCWVGARAVILPGVTIAEGCVIGAGAVVTRDCEPFGLYAGVPARRVRDLVRSDRRTA
jgi:acetyltransferase-like isoleucine patch superfamily enzyme